MNNFIIAGIAGTVVIAGAIGLSIVLNRKRLEEKFAKQTETIDGTLQQSDVISYFRSLSLDEKKDVVFVANCESKEFKLTTKGLVKPKEGYKLIMLGVYDKETNIITSCKFIYSLDWSDDLKSLMGDSPCVVLS